MKIYIADNNEQLLKSLKLFFVNYNIDVRTFSKISLFQKVFNSETPDLVICNPVLQGVSPYFLVKWMKETNKSVPVIVYCETPTKDIILLARKYAVTAFMVYPFKKEELLLRVKKILNINLELTNAVQDEDASNIIDKEKRKNEILLQIDKLPSFPSIIREIEALINSHDSDAKDFEEVIKKDQVITAKVLKIVNSPFYSLARKFTTISESVAYIGLDALRSIVYSASASNILKGSFAAYGYKKDQLWKHSFTTAFLSKYISKFLKLNDKTSEELFVGGLLHDIGKIIIGLLAKKENILFKSGNNVSDLLGEEKNYFYFSHEEVGGLIADKWRLPDLHKTVIVSHHTPKNKIIGIVFLADNLSKLLVGIACEEEILINDFKEILNIDEEVYTNIKEETSEMFQKLEQEGIFS